MSLDIYLKSEEREVDCDCDRCGHRHKSKITDTLFSANITHNLGRMAEAAGIYNCLWRAKENGFTKAGQLIEPITLGIALMKADRPKFEALNSSNGWGLYENFLPWLERLLAACETFPDAAIGVLR